MATNNRNDGVRHLLAAYDLGADKIYGHIKTTKNRTTFLAFCRYLRSLYPPEVRIAIVMDNFSPHLSTKKDTRVGDWAAANNVELAYVPNNASWLNRIEAPTLGIRHVVTPRWLQTVATVSTSLGDDPIRGRRSGRCRSRSLGEMLVRVPDLVIGVGLPKDDPAWHNCGHVE